MQKLPSVASVSEAEALDTIVQCRLEAASLVNSEEYGTAIRIIGDVVKWSAEVMDRLRPTMQLSMQVIALRADLGSAYAILGHKERATHEFKVISDIVRMVVGHCPCGLESSDLECPVDPCRWPG
ncbi:hypothetical protein [Streptomyces sp. NPDC001410]|uniref:hypothetical protein n=1 Tax=Streptomyces sp. NPDC001410 TaxID=3364574 RepID=UPI0036C21B48